MGRDVLVVLGLGAWIADLVLLGAALAALVDGAGYGGPLVSLGLLLVLFALSLVVPVWLGIGTWRASQKQGTKLGPLWFVAPAIMLVNVLLMVVGLALGGVGAVGTHGTWLLTELFGVEAETELEQPSGPSNYPGTGANEVPPGPPSAVPSSPATPPATGDAVLPPPDAEPAAPGIELELQLPPRAETAATAPSTPVWELPDEVWSFGYQREGLDQPVAIASAEDGGIVVIGGPAGVTRGRTLSGAPVSLGHPAAVAVSRIDAKGKLRWTRLLDPVSLAPDAAVDREGAVYLAGVSDGRSFALLEDPAAPPDCRGAGTERCVFLLKLNRDGSFAWIYRAPAAPDTEVTAVAVEGSGRAVLAGIRKAAGTDLPGSEAAAGEARDSFLTVVDESGALAYSRTWAYPTLRPAALVADDRGVLLAGSFTAAVLELADRRLVNLGYGADCVVAQLDPAGEVAWAWRLGGPGEDRIGGLGRTPAGDAVLALSVTGDPLDLGGGLLGALGGTDIAFVGLDVHGAHRWSLRMGGEGDDEVVDLAVDRAGAAYWVGTTSSRGIHLGDDRHAQLGPDDRLMAKLSADGLPIWSARHRSEDVPGAHRVAAPAPGTLVVTGGGVVGVGPTDWLPLAATRYTDAPAKPPAPVGRDRTAPPPVRPAASRLPGFLLALSPPPVNARHEASVHPYVAALLAAVSETLPTEAFDPMRRIPIAHSDGLDEEALRLGLTDTVVRELLPAAVEASDPAIAKALRGLPKIRDFESADRALTMLQAGRKTFTGSPGWHVPEAGVAVLSAEAEVGPSGRRAAHVKALAAALRIVVTDTPDEAGIEAVRKALAERIGGSP